MPWLTAKMSAMPIMPMLPAKAVSAVRPFFVARFLSERENAVRKLMEGLRRLLSASALSRDAAARDSASASDSGMESLCTSPSSMRTMRVE